MYISHKSNVLQKVHETEWQCRRNSKGQTKAEYWTWIASITTQDENGHDVVTYPSEDFTIVECTDEDVQARLNQLGDYQSNSPATGTIYNIKWSDDIGNAEEILDNDGNSHDPKQYVQSHLKGDDTAKTARLLAEEWTRIRAERDRLLTESDWTQANDTALTSAKVTAWATYRTSLRTLPVDQSSKTTYASITWPDKP
jgi:hypothetical protein